MKDDESNLFTWNDLVLIKFDALSSYSPGKIAIVCGMTQVESEFQVQTHKIDIGDWIYTLEFSDGSSIEVPEVYLESLKEIKDDGSNTNPEKNCTFQ